MINIEILWSYFEKLGVEATLSINGQEAIDNCIKCIDEIGNLDVIEGEFQPIDLCLLDF